MTSRQRTRQSRGIPTGGEYAPESFTSAHNDLTGADVPTGDAFDPDDFQAIFDEYRDQMTEVDPSEMLRIAELSARKRTPAYMADRVDDISGDSLAYYLNARRNAQIRLVKDHLDATGTVVIDGKTRRSSGGTPVTPAGPLANPAGYLNTVTSGIVQRYTTGSDQSADRNAIKMLMGAQSEMHNTHGRAMTESEMQVASDEIRLSMPKGRRPVKDFHKMRDLVQSVSTQPDEEGFTQWDGWTPDNDHSTTITQSGHVGGPTDDQVDDLHDVLEESSKRMQKARAYDVLAGMEGAPTVAQESMSANSSKAARTTIRDAGGARRAIAAWKDETITSEQEKALFAPFGDPGYDDQCDIVDVLESQPMHTDDLWEGALTRSTKVRRQESQRAA